jgi:hypothetical protein
MLHSFWYIVAEDGDACPLGATYAERNIKHLCSSLEMHWVLPGWKPVGGRRCCGLPLFLSVSVFWDDVDDIGQVLLRCRNSLTEAGCRIKPIFSLHRGINKKINKAQLLTM